MLRIFNRMIKKVIMKVRNNNKIVRNDSKIVRNDNKIVRNDSKMYFYKFLSNIIYKFFK